jgi:hypothetical protein
MHFAARLWVPLVFVADVDLVALGFSVRFVVVPSKLVAAVNCNFAFQADYETMHQSQVASLK